MGQRRTKYLCRCMLMDVARYPSDKHQDHPLRVLRLFSCCKGGIRPIDIQERVKSLNQLVRGILSGLLSFASLYEAFS